MKHAYVICLVMWVFVSKSAAGFLGSAGNDSPLDHAKVLTNDHTGLEREKRETVTDAEQVAQLIAENKALRKEKAALEAHVYRLRVVNDELAEKNAKLKRENKQLPDQLRQANDALKDANKQINVLTAATTALEGERDKLAAALLDTEDALRGAENELANATAAITAVRKEMEERLRDKDEEIEAVRKSGQHVIEELKRTLIEVETHYKSEISRNKTKCETDIREFETALDNAYRANAEYIEQIKVLETRNKELEAALEDVQSKLNDARDTELKLANATTAIRAEMEEKLSDKDEKIEALKKSCQRDIDELKRTLVQVKSRYKSKISQIKTKCKTDIRELETALDNANRATAKYISQVMVMLNTKKELEAALEDCQSKLDDALRDTELKLANATAAIRAEMEAKLSDKDEEIEALRHSRKQAIEEHKKTLEKIKTLCKLSVSQVKTKCKSNTRELESALDHSNSANAEYIKQIETLQTRIKELEALLEDTRGQLDETQLS